MIRHTRISAQSTVTSKGQTTIPKDVRDALGLVDGTRIEWIVTDGSLTIRPRTLRAVDLAGFLGEPPNGRHLTIEDMNNAIGEAVVARFGRSRR
jgi:AbrB family looped-hinge helix DNA binding protein